MPRRKMLVLSMNDPSGVSISVHQLVPRSVLVRLFERQPPSLGHIVVFVFDIRAAVQLGCGTGLAVRHVPIAVVVGPTPPGATTADIL